MHLADSLEENIFSWGLNTASLVIVEQRNVHYIASPSAGGESWPMFASKIQAVWDNPTTKCTIIMFQPGKQIEA